MYQFQKPPHVERVPCVSERREKKVGRTSLGMLPGRMGRVTCVAAETPPAEPAGAEVDDLSRLPGTGLFPSSSPTWALHYAPAPSTFSPCSELCPHILAPRFLYVGVLTPSSFSGLFCSPLSIPVSGLELLSGNHAITPGLAVENPGPRIPATSRSESEVHRVEGSLQVRGRRDTGSSLGAL